MASVYRALSRVISASALAKNVGPLSLIRSNCTAAPLTEKFDKMVKNGKVVVFMKGVPEQPMCGFSNAVVQIMRMHGVQYEAHNVLADEDIRQGMYFSNKSIANE